MDFQGGHSRGEGLGDQLRQWSEPVDLSTGLFVSVVVVATLLQVAMVVAGHYKKSVSNWFAVGGMGISLIAGLCYASLARHASIGDSIIGATLAGAACALVGIAVSYFLRDVQAQLLLLGTLSSAVTGAIGGWIGHLVAKQG